MVTGIHIGNEPGTIKAAREAIVEILKVAGTENAQVAAVNALAELARCPQSISLSDVSIADNKRKR